MLLAMFTYFMKPDNLKNAASKTASPHCGVVGWKTGYVI